ncbi:MAG: cell division protein ZapA [Clostridiales bacterium]|nr:cell division protein ZapA [Clostridiales bacterium]
MANRINITINSRVYTVVANEDTDYLKKLCDYVNEKVNLVLREGQHVTGEKPVVLAALNICDEYFKLLDNSEPTEKLSELLIENKKLEAEIRSMKKAEQESSKQAAEIKDELNITTKVLDETEEKVKFLEGQIKIKENQLKKQRSEFAIREKELLDMLEEK